MDRATIVTPWHRRISTNSDGAGDYLVVEDTNPYLPGGNREITSSLRHEDRIRLGMACLGEDLMSIFFDFDAAITWLQQGLDVVPIAEHLRSAHTKFGRLMDIKEGATNAPE